MNHPLEVDPECLPVFRRREADGLIQPGEVRHIRIGDQGDLPVSKVYPPLDPVEQQRQVETIAQAAEGHRASATTPPRSIYGALVAEADRMIVPETIIRRTVQFGLSHYSELDKEGHWQRTLEHLHEKYAEGGYLHLLIPGSPNEEPLARLRSIIRDENHLRVLFDTIFAEETGNP